MIIQRLDEAKPNWREGINMYAGTSTGGLIALGLAKGKTPSELMDVYATQGKIIFARRLGHEIAELVDLVGPKYDSTNREAVFHQVLGDDLLKDCLNADGTRGHVCITAFDLKDAKDSGQPLRNWKSKIFHNIPVAVDTNDGAELAYKVALRTSAAHRTSHPLTVLLTAAYSRTIPRCAPWRRRWISALRGRSTSPQSGCYRWARDIPLRTSKPTGIGA